jgi:hypothetical protein
MKEAKWEIMGSFTNHEINVEKADEKNGFTAEPQSVAERAQRSFSALSQRSSAPRR